MANFKGGSFKDHNLIVTVPENGKTYAKGHKGDPKFVNGAFIDAELDQSLKNPKAASEGTSKGVQTDPHLTHVRQKYTTKDGKTAYGTSHREWYAKSQIDKIVKAAGNKVVPAKGGKAYGVHADLLENSNKHMVINTKTLKKTTNRFFGKNTLSKQAAVTKGAQDYERAQYNANKQAQAGKQAPTAAKQAPAKDAKAASKDVDGPTF